MTTKLEGKVAIITGGTSGIGLATAKLFHAEGARVVVTGSNPATVARARDELRGVAEVRASDASSSDDLAALVAHVLASYGKLDSSSSTPASCASARSQPSPKRSSTRSFGST